MERKDRFKTVQTALSCTLVALILQALPAGFPLGVQEAQAKTKDQYPPSKWGAPPASPLVGLRPGLAATEAEEWTDGKPLLGGGRGPASAAVADKLVTTRTVDRTSSASDDAMIQRRGVQEISLIAGDLGFFPKTLFVSRDVPVRMFVTGASKQASCIMMDSFQVRKQIRSQRVEEITFIPSVPGRFRFYCPVTGTEGVLIVKELVTADRTPANESIESAAPETPAAPETE